MTPEQCRAARALLDWNAERLAAEAQVSPSTVRNFEAGRGKPPKPLLLTSMQSELEKAGVIFIPSNGEGAGVRLKKATAE
jgi:transcriptional regulator with XRE-family HTH domain